MAAIARHVQGSTMQRALGSKNFAQIIPYLLPSQPSCGILRYCNSRNLYLCGTLYLFFYSTLCIFQTSKVTVFSTMESISKYAKEEKAPVRLLIPILVSYGN